MRRSLLSFAALAVTALALQGLPAKAQTSTSGSNSTSSSGSTSSSTSGSSTTSGTSGNRQNQNTRQNATTNNSTSVPITFNSGAAGGATDPAGANGINGSNGGGGNNPPFYGQSSIEVRTTPTVYAPPVQGGNPCTVGVSGGLSVVGWGAALGGTWVDQDCADRQKIAMIHNAGYQKAARELMCNDRATYIAFRGTETPCNPRPQFDGPGAPPPPIVQQQPVPIAPPPQQITTIKDRTNLPRCSRTITDNCYAG